MRKVLRILSSFNNIEHNLSPPSYYQFVVFSLHHYKSKIAGGGNRQHICLKKG